MCKLNLLCKEPDGQCNCARKASKISELNKSSCGLLCSILSYLKTQPEILRSLSESSKVPIEEIISSLPSFETASDIRITPSNYI